jgi:hypothetical protein
MKREREGILVGAGAGLTLIVLLVLQSFAGSGLFTARTLTSTVTALSAPTEDYNQVAYANNLLLLDSDSIPALVSGYGSNATVRWTGENADGLRGNYTRGNIGELFGSFMNHMVNFSVSNESQTLAPEGGYWVVNSTFDIAGYSGLIGNFNGTIAAQDSHAHAGNTWLISSESWDHLQYYEQYRNFGP